MPCVCVIAPLVMFALNNVMIQKVLSYIITLFLQSGTSSALPYETIVFLFSYIIVRFPMFQGPS